jgi:DNA polymerase-1
MLVAVDLSQIELRVLAHVSGDPFMQDVFRRNGDLHTETAALMYGVPIDQVTKDQRANAKTLNFATVYGSTAQGIMRQMAANGVHKSIEECQDMIDRWYRTYAGVGRWQAKVREEAIRTGRVRDMFGRYRLAPGVGSTIRSVREKTLREVINAPIQSSAQGIIKEAMGELVPVVRDWLAQGLHILPLIQIHDELIFEVQHNKVEEVGRVVAWHMGNAVKLDIPVPTDVEVGATWADVG